MTETLPEQLHAPGAAVATRQQDNTELDSSDVRLPRMKLAQHLSRVVTDELVPYGAIYVVRDQDDNEPEVLAAPASAKGKVGDAVRFYVLAVRKGYSYTDPQGDLAISHSGQYPNLALVKGEDPRNVRRTYDYTLVLPTFTDLPVQFLMHGKWGGQAAKSLNTRLLLAKQQGVEPSSVAFKLQAKKAESDRGPYAAAVIGIDKVPAKDAAADAELVGSLAGLVGAAPVAPAEAPESTTDAAPSLA
jgi:hypothetical protein